MLGFSDNFFFIKISYHLILLWHDWLTYILSCMFYFIFLFIYVYLADIQNDVIDKIPSTESTEIMREFDFLSQEEQREIGKLVEWNGRLHPLFLFIAIWSSMLGLNCVGNSWTRKLFLIILAYVICINSLYCLSFRWCSEPWPKPGMKITLLTCNMAT